MSNAVARETFAIERIYPNCVAHVWACWSVPEKKAAWLGAADLEMDFRPGGAESSSFRDEHGRHLNQGRYFEIVEQERIILAYSMSVNGRVHTVSLATVEFFDQDGGTRVRYSEQMCVIPPSDGGTGRRAGWQALLERLAGGLASETDPR